MLTRAFTEQGLEVPAALAALLSVIIALFAGAAGTDDRDELPSRHRERHGVQERDPIPVAEPDLPGKLVDVDSDTASVDCCDVVL